MHLFFRQIISFYVINALNQDFNKQWRLNLIYNQSKYLHIFFKFICRSENVSVPKGLIFKFLYFANKIKKPSKKPFVFVAEKISFSFFTTRKSAAFYVSRRSAKDTLRAAWNIYLNRGFFHLSYISGDLFQGAGM